MLIISERLNRRLFNEKDVTYVSTLAHNIEANLTKSQINKLADSDMVTHIYAVEESEYNLDFTETPEIRAVSSTSTYSEHLYKMTWLNTTRDAFGLTGTGVNVGVFDEGYLDEPYLEEHYDTTIEVQSYPSEIYVNNHTYNVLAILAGYVEDGTKVTKTVTINRIGKLFRAVAAWDKVNMLNGNQSCEDSTVTSEVLDQFYLSVTTPSGEVYTSFYEYDNKQVVAFITEETGTYTISLSRYPGGNSQKVIEYGISYSLINN